MTHTIHLRRVYDRTPAPEGCRILIDRMWPRGVSREQAALDFWAKEAAPTRELRTWFSHDAGRFEAFRSFYRKQLGDNPAALDFARRCRDLLETRDIVLLYGAKDPNCNHALILKEWLIDQMRDPQAERTA